MSRSSFGARGAGWLAGALLMLAAASLRGQSAWNEVPAEMHRTGTFRNRALRESSGVAVSREHPGILWTFNDSGNPPFLFATDTLGTDRGTFEVIGAENIDWEAMALAPCGPASCIYIADTGDNLEHRSSVRLYRFPEPTPVPASSRRWRTAPAQSVMVRYPGGGRDVEAMFVDLAGNVYLISKGLLSPVRLFRVPASAWRTGTGVAHSLGNLPIDSGPSLERLVTDAALASNGRTVVVRTYREIYFFKLDDSGRLVASDGARACSVKGMEPQGEGVAWLDDTTLVLTSERGSRAGTITLARCPASKVSSERRARNLLNLRPTSR